MKKELTEKDKIGQHFIMGVNNHNIDDIIFLIENYHIGGVILFKNNYDSYEEMLKTIKKLKKANRKNKLPLFITIDEEFGKVNRMPKEIIPMRNINDVSKKHPELISEFAGITACLLAESGINMNLAPVLDIDNNSKSKVIYKRCFYGDEKKISEAAIIYVNKFKKNNVISVVKHFPGHGCSKRDSHFSVPYVFHYENVLKEHIIPFERTFNDTDAIMLGHLIIRKLTKGMPASIQNSFIKEYLRNKYDNLVISDEINMLKRNILWPIYKRKLLKADIDLVLIKIKNKKEGIRLINKYTKMHDSKLLEKSIERIISIKEKYNINDDTKFKGANIEKINERINIINDTVNI